MNDIVERLDTVRESLEAGCEDWPIASQIWECATAASEIKTLRSQLAESQAREEKLRSYFKEFTNTEPCDCGCSSRSKSVPVSPLRAMFIANAALSEPTDSSMFEELRNDAERYRFVRDTKIQLMNL